MRIALLVGASPIRSAGGPCVRLKKGLWRIEMEGVKDSILRLHFDAPQAGSASVPNDYCVAVTGPCEVQLFFEVRGTESHISAYAEKIA